MKMNEELKHYLEVEIELSQENKAYHSVYYDGIDVGSDELKNKLLESHIRFCKRIIKEFCEDKKTSEDIVRDKSVDGINRMMSKILSAKDEQIAELKLENVELKTEHVCHDALDKAQDEFMKCVTEDGVDTDKLDAIKNWYFEVGDYLEIKQNYLNGNIGMSLDNFDEDD